MGEEKSNKLKRLEGSKQRHFGMGQSKTTHQPPMLPIPLDLAHTRRLGTCLNSNNNNDNNNFISKALKSTNCPKRFTIVIFMAYSTVPVR